ncbi:hypothetical protein FQN54_005103 [Arachnomyces sp. PD_36]|nr:hypothetical protein FQN54_005103 [Arachnomyces sp. PD_36]
MDIPFHLTVADALGQVARISDRDIQSFVVVYISVAVCCFITLLSKLEVGRKFLNRILWFFDGILGGAAHTVSLSGPSGLPIVGSLLELSNGHVPKIAEWTRKYGDVIRVSLGEREAVLISTREALSKTIIKQGAAYQSRPTFKLFHSDFASSGIFTLGTSPYSDRLVRTRKAVSSQLAPRILPAYTPVVNPRLKQLLGEVLTVSDGPAVDMAKTFHRFGTGQIAEQLMGTPLDQDLVGMLAENETNIFRQRSIGSPVRDYIPLLRSVGWLRYAIGKFLGIKGWASDEKEEKARAYRRTQQAYINKLVGGLKDRIENGDETPSILGNILRQGFLKEEEIILASNTGSMETPLILFTNPSSNFHSSTVAAGMNIGYVLTWLIGYLANRSDLQQNGYEAIREVYNGDAPEPHEFDRVEYVKALHTEGTRIYTPVRLGFPRQTLDGASYDGHTIPQGTVRILPPAEVHNCLVESISDSHRPACPHEPDGRNRDPIAFDRPEEYLPERWLDGRKGRTDLPGQHGAKLGVTHLTYGCGRRICPGIDVANRCIYSTLVLLLHFFTWERQPLGEEEKKHVFPPFRAQRECSLEMDAIADTATPTEAQAIPWSAGIRFHCRDPEGLRAWIASGDT